jgi:hypothetical protein
MTKRTRRKMMRLAASFRDALGKAMEAQPTQVVGDPSRGQLAGLFPQQWSKMREALPDHGGKCEGAGRVIQFGWSFRFRRWTYHRRRCVATEEDDPKRAYVPKAELQSVKATSLWTSRPVRSAKARAYRFPRKMSRTIDPPNGSN